MDDAIKHFVDKILAINPEMEDFVGGGVVAETGSHNASGQVVYELRKATLEFARAYNDLKTPADELRRLAMQVEAGLLTVATIMRFTPEFTDDSVNQLHGFVRLRQNHKL